MTPAQMEQMKKMSEEISKHKDILQEAKELGITDPKQPFIVRKKTYISKERTLKGNEDVEQVIKYHIDALYDLIPYFQMLSTIRQEI